MAVTMQQVLAILNRDEPDYEMARALGPDALPLLQQLINGGDHMRASKATSAAGVIDGPAAVSVLEHAAKSQVAAVRVNAAAAVGHLAPTLGASVLVHLLSDHDLGVRRRALRAAAGRRDPALQAGIEKMSASDHNPRLRAEAAEVLKRR